MTMAAHKTSAEFHKEVGIVTGAKGYLLSLEGLPSAKVDDLLHDEEGNRALVTSLRTGTAEALMLDSAPVRPGNRFFLQKDRTLFSFGDHLLGRIVSATGDVLDEKSGLPPPNTPLELNVVASGISSREYISKQFPTGITFVDTLFPIGKGQRQLVFGPIRSGKTNFLSDVVANQRDRATVCIYAMIGKPVDAIRSVTTRIFGENGNKNAIVLAALSNEPSPLIAIAPSVAFSMAEHFASQGSDVLLILDDLGTHAKYLREIALLEGRLPGRESYPGDVFYQHAHLMERSGHFNPEAGGGSITLLPVLETDIKNVTDLIPTNLMAATDGHFSFSAPLRAQGYYPPILESHSVTRVGRNTQTLVQKQLATRVLALLADYEKQKEYSKFGAQLSEGTREILRRGAMVREITSQRPYDHIPIEVQSILLSLVFTSIFEGRDEVFVRRSKTALIEGIYKEQALQGIRELTKTDTPFDAFKERLEEEKAVFEKICQL